MTEQEKAAWVAGTEAAATRGVTIDANPWTVKHDDPGKNKTEKSLFDAWQKGYNDQMGVINWGKCLSE